MDENGRTWSLGRLLSFTNMVFFHFHVSESECNFELLDYLGQLLCKPANEPPASEGGAFLLDNS